MIRRRVLSAMQKEEHSEELPSNYTAVNYLQSSGGQWIDTGYKYGAQSGLELTVDGSSSDGTVIGAQDSKGIFVAVFSDALYMARKNTGWMSKIGLTHPIKIVNSGGVFTVTDSAGKTRSATVDDSGFVGPDLTIYLFARHLTAGPKIASGTTKIYGCKFFEGGEPAADIRPCLDSAGNPCMYDVIRRRKFANAGSGSFTWG